MRLIITNGQSGIEALRNAGIGGKMLSWDDVLHDGPVPATDSLEALSEHRARYIVSCGWGDLEEVLERFRERDAVLASADEFDEVVLYFEHDLYDQLQLLQVLYFIAFSPKLSQAQPPTFIGHATAGELAGAFESRRAVTAEERDYARRAWRAFTGDQPEGLIPFLTEATPAPLVNVPPAFRRLVQEYPDANYGLSRTERQILIELKNRESRPGPLFQACQRREEAPFMGDWSFWQRLLALHGGPSPLIRIDPALTSFPPPKNDFRELLEAQITITENGEQVLNDSSRRLRRGIAETWIGGVCVSEQNPWRWDSEKNCFTLLL